MVLIAVVWLLASLKP